MKAKTLNTAKRMLTLVLSAALALCLASPCLAAGENDATLVRVGYFAFDGYHMQDENGLRSGYGYELLQHLSGYANFKYEYVGYDKSWSEMQEMLARGEIDILTSAQKTPEREESFDFSDSNIGFSSAILTVKAGDNRFLLEDFANWNGIRVGMIEDNSRNSSFADYAREHSFTYTPVFFESTEEMMKELKEGGADKSIDAVLTSNLRHIEDEWVLAQFDTSPFYIMVKKGNTELLGRINSALAQLDSNEPSIRTMLMSKYYTPASADEIAFTPEERAYIKSMQGTKLTALINPDRAPYSWYENGKLTGILYDIACEMIARSGLNIEFVEAHDRDAYQSLLNKGSTDLRFDAAYSFNQAEKDGYWLTSPYISVPVAKLYRSDRKEFHSVVVPDNRDVYDKYAGYLEEKGLAVTYAASVDEAVSGVEDNRYDAAFLALDTANMAARNDVKNRLTAEELFGESFSFCVAVNEDQSSLLFSVISKVVASFTEQENDGIRQGYASAMEQPFSLAGYFYDYPLQVLVLVAAVLLLVILVVILLQQRKRRKFEHAHLEKEKKQNELLKDALDTAEKAGEAKSQFLSRVSHEMRTPLNAIIGFVELARGAEPEQKENYLASCDLASKQLLNVINDVLDMSSIESGKLRISSAPFNFKHLVSSLTNIYGTQCRQKNVEFETKILTPTEDWLVGDELRVNQILMNLLGNAVKFTSRGHIWLTISQTEVSESKLFLRFQISDTGCGMSEEMKNRLFMPFEQESVATAKKYGGSGLGLSIVKNLTGLMGGQVSVESVQGEGSVFTVDLPFRKPEAKKDLALPKTVENLHILAVDDEESERQYISIVLRRMNVRFFCAASGGEALSEMERADSQNDPYNVCLVDWRMPDMDGVDTTRRIREKYGSDVVVVVASAYDFQEAGEAAREAGANLFVSKPLFQSTLFDLLMTLTGGKIAKPKDESESWDFAGKRVLLVEDNALNQIVAKGYLAKFNVVVELAADGKEAVEMFEHSAAGYYDAILMDIQMPVMDGFEATRHIRESKHTQAKTVQIIAQTADAFNEDIARALAGGMNAHVAKPIKPNLLAKALYTAFAANEEGKKI